MSYLRCDACLMLFSEENFVQHHHETLASFTVIMSPETVVAGDGVDEKQEVVPAEVPSRHLPTGTLQGGNSMGTKEWAQRRMIEEKKRQEERATEYADFLKLPKGTTRLELLADEPRTLEGKFGPQTVFKVRRDGKVYDWAINDRNFSLLRGLAQLMANDVAAVSVTRVGEGTDTIYEVTEA